MRAAAAYMMGRYRDAQNELNTPAFDSDRHAAFWRGLRDLARMLEETNPAAVAEIRGLFAKQ